MRIMDNKIYGITYLINHFEFNTSVIRLLGHVVAFYSFLSPDYINNKTAKRKKKGS